MKRRLIVALYIIFMLIIISPLAFQLFQWNKIAAETFLSKEAGFIYNFMAYILEPLLLIFWIYVIYVTAASLRFHQNSNMIFN